MKILQNSCLKLVIFSCFLNVFSLCETMFPRLLWIYWTDQTQLSIQRQMFLGKIQQHISNQPGWQLNFLTDKNYKQYLPTQISFNLTIVQSPALKSDIIRLAALCQYGGMWIDLTSIFIESFEWVENLVNDTNVINRNAKHSFQPDVLMFQWESSRYRTVDLNQNTNPMNNDPGYQTWFILAKKGTNFMYQWNKVFLEYVFYNTQTIFARQKKYNIFIGSTSYTPYLKIYYAMFEVLQKKQQELDRSTSLSQRISAPVYYKIWTIDCSTGPCINYFFEPHLKLPNQYQITLFAMSQKQMLEFYGKKELRYLIKFINSRTKQLIKLLQQFNNPSNKNKNLTEMFFQKQSTLDSCKSLEFIASDSVIYTKFIKNNPIKNNYNRVITPQQKFQYYKFCDQYENNKSYAKRLVSYFESYNLSSAGYICYFLVQPLGHLVIFFILCGIVVKAYYKKCNFNKSFNYAMVNFCPIEKLCLKIDEFLQKQKINIPYPILVVVYAFPLYRAAMTYQTKNYRQMYTETMLLTVLAFLGHKFSKIHFLRSKFMEKWLVLFMAVEQIIYLSAAKLICDLLYNRWTPIYCYAIFFGLVMPSLIKCVNSISLQKHASLLDISSYFRNKHFLIVTIILCAFGLIPNLPFMMINGVYLRTIIANLAIVYSIYLTVEIIYAYLNMFSFKEMIGKQGITSKSKRKVIRSIRKVLLNYFIMLIVYCIMFRFQFGIYGRTFVRTLGFNIATFLLAIFYSTQIKVMNPKKKILNIQIVENGFNIYKLSLATLFALVFQLLIVLVYKR